MPPISRNWTPHFSCQVGRESKVPLEANASRGGRYRLILIRLAPSQRVIGRGFEAARTQIILSSRRNVGRASGLAARP
jgi:hypothetical protein